MDTDENRWGGVSTPRPIVTSVILSNRPHRQRGCIGKEVTPEKGDFLRRVMRMIRLHTAVLGAVALLVTLVAGAPALAGPHDDAISGESGEPGSKWEIGYALGLSTALSANVTAGVELKDFEGKAYAIPGLYITLGPASA